MSKCFACGGVVAKKLSAGGEVDSDDETEIDDELLPDDDTQEDVPPEKTRANFVTAILRKKRA